MVIKAILFDMIGTLVMERGPSIVNRCLILAFRNNGMEIPVERIKTRRGMDKREMVNELLQEERSLVPAELILDSFKMIFKEESKNFYPNPGANVILEYVRTKGIVTGLGSGLPRDLFESIFNHMGWERTLFDYIGIAEETGRGRPQPDMVFDMMKRCNLGPGHFLKLGDTVADIQEGKNAGVLTAVLLSGTQEEQVLLKEKPDIVLRSLYELKEIC